MGHRSKLCPTGQVQDATLRKQGLDWSCPLLFITNLLCMGSSSARGLRVGDYALNLR